MTHQLSQPSIDFIQSGRTTSVGNGQSSLSDAKFLALKSDTNMRAALVTAGYSAAAIKSMTTNDMVYAVNLLAL